MAYSTGTYTSQNNALDLWRAFLLANGWTINDFSDDDSDYGGGPYTGKRLHVEKTIGTTDCYFNMRSCENQNIFNDGYASDADNRVTGIACNGSTGYNATDSWDLQPGAESKGGCVDEMDTGDYFFFASSTTATAIFQTSSLYSDYRVLTFGITALGLPYFWCSGGTKTLSYASYPTWNMRSFLFGMGYGSTGVHTYNGAVYGTSWMYHFGNATGGSTYAPNNSLNCLLHGIHDYTASEDTNGTASVYGSNIAAPVANSPDATRGNAPLTPVQITAKTVSGIQPMGTLEGICALNTRYYLNGDEITVGSDTYKVFLITNYFKRIGIAYKK